MHRTYENDDIVVFWNSDKCFHAKKCVEGSPKTFCPGQRPWINLSNAETKEIWQAISRCPSGALSCLYRHNIEVALDRENLRSVAMDNGKEIGECACQIVDGNWNIYHTGVSAEYRGKGIAKRLVYKLLEEAERNEVKVTATCSYAKKMLENE